MFGGMQRNRIPEHYTLIRQHDPGGLSTGALSVRGQLQLAFCRLNARAVIGCEYLRRYLSVSPIYYLPPNL